MVPEIFLKIGDCKNDLAASFCALSKEITQGLSHSHLVSFWFGWQFWSNLCGFIVIYTLFMLPTLPEIRSYKLGEGGLGVFWWVTEE